jgi:proline iminopeptidase
MFVTVNGVRLFFDVLNPGLHLDDAGRLEEKPTLVCLHGGPGGDHQTMRPAFDVFAGAAQIIYLDQRGGGRSEHGPPESWTLDQWADDVRAFCDALGIEKPIIIGQSGGAIVAQAYLARHPGHAAGVILVNACSRMDRDVLVAGFATLGGLAAGEAARAMYERGAPEDVPGFFRHCLPFYGVRPPDPAAAASMQARAHFNFAVSQHFFGPGGEAFRFDHRAVLGRAACPVLVMVGVRDPVTRPEWGREVFEALRPGLGRLVLLEEASHMIPSDAPERFEGEVMAFVESLSG